MVDTIGATTLAGSDRLRMYWVAIMMNVARSADYFASVWGLITSGLLMSSTTPTSGGSDRFFWWYSILSVVFYGALGLLTFRGAEFGVPSRIGLGFVALVLALVGGVSGLIFFGVPIAMIVIASFARHPNGRGTERKSL